MVHKIRFSYSVWDTSPSEKYGMGLKMKNHTIPYRMLPLEIIDKIVRLLELSDLIVHVLTASQLLV